MTTFKLSTYAPTQKDTSSLGTSLIFSSPSRYCLENPKSISLMSASSSFEVKMKFSSLRSRCTMLALCKYLVCDEKKQNKLVAVRSKVGW